MFAIAHADRRPAGLSGGRRAVPAGILTRRGIDSGQDHPARGLGQLGPRWQDAGQVGVNRGVFLVAVVKAR